MKDSFEGYDPNKASLLRGESLVPPEDDGISKIALERRITNKFKSNLADKIQKFGAKKKVTDFSDLFQSVEF